MARVDMSLLLATMKATDTQVGEWVNVMGYVTHEGSNPIRQKGRNIRVGNGEVRVNVQAIMCWSAGSVKLRVYEQALAERQRIGQDLDE